MFVNPGDSDIVKEWLDIPENTLICFLDQKFDQKIDTFLLSVCKVQSWSQDTVSLV